MRYLPVSMAENKSLPYFGYLCVPQRIWLPQPGERRKTGNPEDRFAVAIIMCSIDNNKMTVCHLAIPREVSRLLWHGVTGR